MEHPISTLALLKGHPWAEIQHPKDDVWSLATGQLRSNWGQPTARVCLCCSKGPTIIYTLIQSSNPIHATVAVAVATPCRLFVVVVDPVNQLHHPSQHRDPLHRRQPTNRSSIRASSTVRFPLEGLHLVPQTTQAPGLSTSGSVHLVNSCHRIHNRLIASGQERPLQNQLAILYYKGPHPSMQSLLPNKSPRCVSKMLGGKRNPIVEAESSKIKGWFTPN